jgi:putative thioredoxin
MLEFGQTTTSDAPSDLIKDSSEATFMQDVIEASQDIPVIVDFWAPWCGPCKTLGPALEAAVQAAGGRVKMVKIDVDQNQGIAGQLRIQSIPTVYAFHKGQPVDGFQGALSGSEIAEFVGRVADLGGDGGLSEAVEVAEGMLAEGAASDAAQTFAAILGEDPINAPAYGGLIRSHLALEALEEAETLITNAPEEIANAAEIEAAKAQLELLKQAANAGPEAELRAAVDANPDDNEARLELAKALHAGGDIEGAIDALLELVGRDREWNDGAAKAQLFTIFDALKPEDPLVLAGRRKLSSMIFA